MLRHFQHIGKKAQQEDAYYISNDQRLIVICDGVGGSNHGEFASRTIISSIKNSYQNLKNKSLDKEDITFILSTAIQALNHLAIQDPSLMGASTTLALLYHFKDKSISAHIGDSRVIMISDSEVLWATKDHSMVQELFDAGILNSVEEMQFHPMRNRINRAITAGRQSLNLIEIHDLVDLLNDTIYVLCSDGLLEHYTNESLAESISSMGIDQAWIEIESKCKNESRDNSTVVMLNS